MKYENTFKATDQILCLYLRFSPLYFIHISAGSPWRGIIQLAQGIALGKYGV